MKDLTKGSELKVIFFFSLPILFSSIFQQLYTTCDSIIVGRLVGKIGLASIGTSFPLIFFLLSTAVGISLGSSIVIAQFFGAKDFFNVRLVVTTTFIFLTIFSFFISLLGIVFTPMILKVMSVPNDIFSLAAVYLKIMFSGTLFLFLYNGISSILRGLGDSKTPLYILVFTSILNIILDIILVGPLNMGVNGAGIATVISQGLSVILCIIYFNFKHEILKFKISDLKFNHRIFLKILKVGIPSAIQQMSVAFGFMVVVKIVNQFGTNAIAAYTAANRLDTFVSMPSLNLSLALATFVGQNIGAQKYDRIHRGLRSSLLISIIYSLILSVLIYFFKENLIGLFNKDSEVIKIGSEYLLIVGSSYIIFSSMFIMSGLLRGSGDATFAMIASVFALWPVRILFAYLFSKIIGITGVWYSFPLGWIIGLTLLVLRYYRGSWKNKTVIHRFS